MENIRFSVIIPLYNKEKHIARSIESVLNQSYNDFELIVVDDASTDGGLDVAESFSDPRLRIIKSDKQIPSGVSCTRNRGIMLSSNEWVSFLDADDEWRHDYLSAMVKLHEEFPSAAIFSCGWLDYFSDTNIIENKYYQQNKEHGNRLYYRNEFLVNCINRASPVWTSVVTVKRNFIIDTGMFPANGQMLAEDIDTWFRLIMAGNSGAWSNYIGAIYYRNSDNMATKKYIPNRENNHLLKSIDKYIVTENGETLRLLQKYKKIVSRNINKDRREHKFLKLCNNLLGEKISNKLISIIIKQKRRKFRAN